MTFFFRITKKMISQLRPEILASNQLFTAISVLNKYGTFVNLCAIHVLVFKLFQGLFGLTFLGAREAFQNKCTYILGTETYE